MKILNTLALLLLAQYAVAEDLLTVYLDAVQKNSDYRMAQSAVLQSDEAIATARSSLLPQLQVSADYAQIDNSYTTGNPLLSSASNIDTETLGWQLSLNQSLLDFNKWYNYKAGEIQSQQGKVTFAKQGQQLIFDSMTLYLDVLRAHEDFTVSMAEKQALKGQLKRIEDHHEFGMVTLADFYEAQAAHDLASAKLLRAQGSLDSSYKRLRAFTGEKYYQLQQFSDDLPIQLPQQLTEEQWLRVANEYSPDLQLARLEHEAASYQFKSERARHLPTLEANLGYGAMAIDGEQYGTNIDGSSQDATQISVTLKMPLYSGGSVSSSRRKAGANLQEKADGMIGIERNLEELIKNTYADIMIQMAYIKAAEQSLVSTAKALDAAKEGFKQGTRNAVDVLASQNTYFNAKRDVSFSRLEFIQLFFKLKSQAGVLSTKDIAYFNQWLVEAY
jgi:outer membrane protein